MSVVSRLSASRVFLSRACLSTKAGRGAALRAGPARAAIPSSAILRTAVISKHEFAVSQKRSMDMFQGFHCSAMAYDAAEVGENAEEVAVEEEAPEPPPYNPPPPEPNTKLYCGNLSWNVTEQDLRDAFQTYGTVESAEVVMDATGRSRGFGFITMANVEEATKAGEELNTQILDGRELRVNFHKPRDPNAPRPPPRERRGGNRFDNAHRLYVGNLPWSFDDFDLQDTFEEFGNIVDARVITDRDTGRSRGFGFVTMSSEEEIEKAISELDGSVCDGRSIRVNKAER